MFDVKTDKPTKDMGLSYHYKFCAPGAVTSETLGHFLHKVETDAKKMGFHPTAVVTATFANPQEQEFARRLTTGHRLKHPNLKGVVLLREGQVWSHDQVHGDCRIIPERGVVLVVTDERGCETIFGFLKYPGALKDLNDRDFLPTGIGDNWIFRDFVDSPDVRYRKIVKRFADAGYLESEHDEFAGKMSA